LIPTTETSPQFNGSGSGGGSGGSSNNGSNTLTIIIGAAVLGGGIILLAAFFRQRAQNKTRHLPPVTLVAMFNNLAFKQPDDVARNCDAVGVLPVPGRSPSPRALDEDKWYIVGSELSSQMHEEPDPLYYSGRGVNAR